MPSWKALLAAIKSLKSAAVEGGRATECHELVEASECPAFPDVKSHKNQIQKLSRPALKGLDLLHNWPENTTPCMMWIKAAEEGRISYMRDLVNIYPETVMTVTPTRETALHLAARQGHCVAARWFVETLKRTACYEDVINKEDCSDDTVLYFVTPMKQLRTSTGLEESHTDSAMVEINAKKKAGFTALDISDVLPEEENIDMEIEKILRRAGALRGRDIVEQKPDSSNHEVHTELGKQWHHKPLLRQATRTEILTMKYHGLLLTATLLATMTFHAALRAPYCNGFSIKKQGSETNHLFILFNSITFFTSLALITILTYELPIKPWLMSVLFSTTGAYMCLIMATSPHEIDNVLIIGSSIFLAAFFKCLALDVMLLDYLQQICSKMQVIITYHLKAYSATAH